MLAKRVRGWTKFASRFGLPASKFAWTDYCDTGFDNVISIILRLIGGAVVPHFCLGGGGGGGGGGNCPLGKARLNLVSILVN